MGLIVAGADDRLIAPLAGRIRSIVQIGPGQYQLELPLDVPPDRLLAELTAAGARLVSLNPIRATLEDYFVEQVSTQPEVAGRQL